MPGTSVVISAAAYAVYVSPNPEWSLIVTMFPLCASPPSILATVRFIWTTMYVVEYWSEREPFRNTFLSIIGASEVSEGMNMKWNPPVRRLEELLPKFCQ